MHSLEQGNHAPPLLGPQLAPITGPLQGAPQVRGLSPFFHYWEKVTKVTLENELVRPSLCAGEQGQCQRGQVKGAVHLAVTAIMQVL